MSSPPFPIPPAADTFRNICTNALFEINAVSPGEIPSAADINFALSKATQIADLWTAQQVYIFVSDLVSQNPSGVLYLLVPGLSPHTIGPQVLTPPPAQPNFIVAQERPVRIVSANVLLSNVNPIVRFPLQIRDKDWWAKQRVQTIQTSLPTDLYYRPDWPNGSLFFWPVPNFAYQVEFEIETIVQGGLTLDTPFTMPPGYELAMTLTLAEYLCPAFEKTPHPTLVSKAINARSVIMGVNSAPPRINLNDFGEPSSTRPRASFNYRTGMDR